MTSSTSDQKNQQTVVRQPRIPFWRNETIGQKLTLGFLVILVLLAASGAVAYYELATVGGDAKKMESASMQAMDASHLQRLSQTALIPIQDYVLTGDPTARARFDKASSDLDTIIARLGVQVTQTETSGMTMNGMTPSIATPPPTEPAMSGMAPMKSTPLSSEQLSLLQNFNDLWMNVHDKALTIFQIPNPVGNQDAINQLKDMEASAQSMAAFAESIHVVQMESVSRTQDAVDATIFNTSLFLIFAIVGAFLLGAILSRSIGRAISQPMAQLTKISSDISLGDLDTKVDVRGGGEIGELAGAIERMRTSLKMIIERMSDEEDDLRSWTTQLASHELKRKVRGGIISLGGHKYEVGKDLDGQSVFVRLDYDLREIVITPPYGGPRHLALKSS